MHEPGSMASRKSPAPTGLSPARTRNAQFQVSATVSLTTNDTCIVQALRSRVHGLERPAVAKPFIKQNLQDMPDDALELLEPNPPPSTSTVSDDDGSLIWLMRKKTVH